MWACRNSTRCRQVATEYRGAYLQPFILLSCTFFCAAMPVRGVQRVCAIGESSKTQHGDGVPLWMADCGCKSHRTGFYYAGIAQRLCGRLVSVRPRFDSVYRLCGWVERSTISASYTEDSRFDSCARDVKACRVVSHRHAFVVGEVC